MNRPTLSSRRVSEALCTVITEVALLEVALSGSQPVPVRSRRAALRRLAAAERMLTPFRDLLTNSRAIVDQLPGVRLALAQESDVLTERVRDFMSAVRALQAPAP